MKCHLSHDIEQPHSALSGDEPAMTWRLESDAGSLEMTSWWLVWSPLASFAGHTGNGSKSGKKHGIHADDLRRA